VVTLRNSLSGQPINDVEVRRKFSQFGDVKEVKIGDNPHKCVVQQTTGDISNLGKLSSRFVEFYDIRVRVYAEYHYCLPH